MTKALALIDLQNDCFAGGRMELVRADEAVASAARLPDAFRSSGLPAIHIQHVSRRPGATFFIPDTQGAEIHAAVRPGRGEPVRVEHFPNAYRETEQEARLRGLAASPVVFAGMMTHMCVDTTVRAAVDLSFESLLAHDACDTRSLQLGASQVAAADVQIANLAALNETFASVQSTAEIESGL